jgi:hypothetical protein
MAASWSAWVGAWNEVEREAAARGDESIVRVEVVQARAGSGGLLHAAAIGEVEAQAGSGEHVEGLAVDVLEVGQAALVVVVITGDACVLAQEGVDAVGAEVG